MKCANCPKQASTEHFREHPECIPAVRKMSAMASVSQRKNNKGGRPKKTATTSATDDNRSG